MADSSRRNRSDDSSTVNNRVKSRVSISLGGGAVFHTDTTISSPRHEGSSEGESASPSTRGSLRDYQLRSPLFRTLSRSSSGYFSFDLDSLPNSPVLKHESTQTPSPSSQVITHAQWRMAEAQIPEAWEDLYEDLSLNPDWPHIPPPPGVDGDMRPPEEIGQNLRRIGDEYFNLLMQRRQAEPNPRVHQEPVFMLWMGLLIGRLLQIFFWRR